MLYGVAALVTMAGVAAIPVARARSLAVSAVTGPTVGVTCLLSTLISLATVVS
jgi:hypothetical protein